MLPRASLIVLLLIAPAGALRAQRADSASPNLLSMLTELHGPATVIFLDGFRVDSTTAGTRHLDANDLETTDVITGASAQQILGDSGRSVVMVVTTFTSPIKCAMAPLYGPHHHIECRAKSQKSRLVVNGTALDNDSTTANPSKSLCFDQRDLIKVETLASGGGEPVTLITLRKQRPHLCDS